MQSTVHFIRKKEQRYKILCLCLTIESFMSWSLSFLPAFNHENTKNKYLFYQKSLFITKFRSFYLTRNADNHKPKLLAILLHTVDRGLRCSTLINKKHSNALQSANYITNFIYISSLVWELVLSKSKGEERCYFWYWFLRLWKYKPNLQYSFVNVLNIYTT